MSDKKKKWSASKISTFNSCKLKYLYTYINKWKSDVKVNTALADKGSAFHNTVEHYFTGEDKQEFNKRLQENIEKFHVNTTNPDKEYYFDYTKPTTRFFLFWDKFVAAKEKEGYKIGQEETLMGELNGEPCINLESVEPDKQSIMVSRGFGKMIDDIDIVKEAAANYTCMAAAKLRKQKGCAKSLLVFLETNRFRDDLPQYRQHIVVNMPVATNSSMEIVSYMSGGLDKIFIPGYSYKKVGVMLMDIVPENAVQGYLWDNIDREKHKRLMQIMDNTNSKLGSNTLKLAVLGDGEQWKIRQRRLSPCYTTRMEDFPKVK